jgi:predicted aminopeptidase
MIKKRIKLFFELIFLLTVMLCLVANRLVIYGISQGIGQVTMIVNSQPIDTVLTDPSFPDSLKQKLKLIKAIKTFATDSLGILPSQNYTTVYNQHDKPILYTITACEPYSFKAKEWWFPFLGNVSYKGFFNKKEARKEVLLLKGQGYDVDVFSPSGWSTLGWFKDPVQTHMLKQSDGNLANLIIHELTHGTVYIKSDVTFNENLASFIGDKGAEQFLKYKFGERSKELKDYEQHKLDTKCFTNYLLKGKERLDSLYTAMSFVSNPIYNKKQKKKLISEIVTGVYRLPLYNKQNYFNYSLQAFSEGNAFFMSFARYDSQYDELNHDFTQNYHADLKLYLSAMKKKYIL